MPNRYQLIYILLFFLGVGLTGLGMGSILAKGFISVPPFQVALSAIASLAVLVLGLGLLLWWNRIEANEAVDQPLPQLLIPVREEYPRAMVLVKELNPQPSVQVTENGKSARTERANRFQL